MKSPASASPFWNAVTFEPAAKNSLVVFVRRAAHPVIASVAEMKTKKKRIAVVFDLPSAEFIALVALTFSLIAMSIDSMLPALGDIAADLGASGLKTFLYVVLPLTLPGIMVGAFLTFVLAIGDYVTPQILGGNNELLMPQLIMMQIGRRGDFPLASALALILMAVVTLAYLACARWLKLERA